MGGDDCWNCSGSSNLVDPFGQATHRRYCRRHDCRLYPGIQKAVWSRVVDRGFLLDIALSVNLYAHDATIPYQGIHRVSRVWKEEWNKWT